MELLQQDTRGWKELGFKEKSQYILAYCFGIASILLGFISFIWLTYIPSSVIGMSAMWASVCCSILGISMYFKNKMCEFNIEVKDRLKKIDDIEEKMTERLNKDE